MISTLITSAGLSYGLISGVVTCPHCPAQFTWSDCIEASITDEGDELELDMNLRGPGCPKCRRVVPLGRFNLPREDCAQIAQVASRQHRPGKAKAAVAGVWGVRGGLIAAMTFPWSMKDAKCGDRIDQFLVSEDWPKRYGATWIRTAVWGENKERGGQDGERIMVHWDGLHLAWSPVSDWLMVAPMGLLDD